jgi:type IV pilus modification protein PilV
VPTERTRLGSEEGFTLIEVLVAMVILSIGLLGLEALGIGAARSLAEAETRNETVAAATGAMEQTQQRVRRELAATPPAVSTGESCVDDAAAAAEVCSTVSTRSSDAALPMGTARIVVSITPDDGRDPYTITSYLFDPDLP